MEQQSSVSRDPTDQEMKDVKPNVTAIFNLVNSFMPAWENLTPSDELIPARNWFILKSQEEGGLLAALRRFAFETKRDPRATLILMELANSPTSRSATQTNLLISKLFLLLTNLPDKFGAIAALRSIGDAKILK